MSTADVPKYNILSLPATSLGTGTTNEERIGGAGVSMIVPEWATMLRGIYANQQLVTVAANENLNTWGRLDTNDAISLKPFYFLFPQVGCCDATPANTNGTVSEFYPINCPVVPGARIIAYATTLQAVAAQGYVWLDFAFSNDFAKNPTYLDPMPDTQRYRVRGTYTATAAAGRAVGTAYNFNGGRMITEEALNLDLDTGAAATPGLGYCTFESNDVPIWPSTVHVDGHGPQLGASGALLEPGVTRRHIQAPCEKVVWVQDYFTQEGGLVGVAANWISNIEFIR